MEVNINKNLIEFKVKLRTLRVQAGKTQKDIAREIGITHQSFQAYESGSAFPTLENLCKLAILFDVSTDYLLGLSEY
ncbi:MAG: helix-turn-helix transcriptional regulator [Bacillota bacterium]